MRFPLIIMELVPFRVNKFPSPRFFRYSADVKGHNTE